LNPSRLALTLALLGSLTMDATAQRRPGASPGTGEPLIVSVRIGGKAYEGTGPGSCKHAPEASIYDIPAALWMVEYSNRTDDRIRQVNLTLWRPKDGSSDQVSLTLETISSSHRISSGGKAEPVGSATVKLSPYAAGSRFELKGRDGEGATVELSISCPAFAGIEAEGG
jgi:hypothetical protein